MKQRLRLPPYGPEIGPLGAGAVLQLATAVATAGGFPAMPASLTELSSDMASEDLRPVITGVSETSVVRVEVEMDVQSDASWLTDGTLTVNLQASRDPSQGWVTLGVSVPTLPVNVATPATEATPLVPNIMRHTIRFEADLDASAIMNSSLGDTFTARVTVEPSQTGLALETLEAQVRVRILEILSAEDADQDLRRPGAGAYRAPVRQGAILQEDVIRRPVTTDLALGPSATELDGPDPEDMRPGIVPFHLDSSLRVKTQLIVLTDDGWINPGDVVTVSLQVSDDAGATWTEIGVQAAQVEPSIQVAGAPDVANDLRVIVGYEATADLLTALPTFTAGTEVLARAEVSASISGAAVVTNETGSVAATFIKLQEVRA